MDQQKKQMFLNRYNIAIDEDGNPKACGRDATRKLIEIADEIEPMVKHGNVHTGEMNVILLTNLKNNIENL